MPFLRFSRDKRGYETTTLVHAFRRQGRTHPRVLYWFRTPVDVRLGRTALDQDVIRLLEEHHPDVTFDWPKILDGRLSETSEEPVQEGRAAWDRRPAGGPQPRRRPRREAPPPAIPLAEPEQPALAFLEPATSPPAATPATPGEVDEVEASEPEPPARPVSAATERFSPEDLARLRGRYAALLSRIETHTTDAAQAEEARGRCDTLNPDAWVTPADVTQALEHYEATYKTLRDLLGWSHEGRRRRVGKKA